MLSAFSKLAADKDVSEKIREIITSPEKSQTSPPSPLSPPSPPSPPSADGENKTLKSGKALLLALKPYLDDGRKEKIEKILGAMRLAEYAQVFKNLM